MKSTLEPRTASTREAISLLGRRLFDDARAAGWLRPRAVRPHGARGPIPAVYAVADLREVEDRVLAGEYPNPNPSDA